MEEGAIVSAYDPQAMEKARPILPSINYCADPYEAAEGADAILIVTEWASFAKSTGSVVAAIVEHPLIVDGRNMLKPEDVTAHGFHYVSIGRTPQYPIEGPAL